MDESGRKAVELRPPAAAPVSSLADALSKTVWVGGLNPTTPREDILAHLSAFGHIYQYVIAGTFGFFEYTSVVGAQGCLALDGKELIDTKLRVTSSTSMVRGGRVLSQQEQEKYLRAAWELQRRAAEERAAAKEAEQNEAAQPEAPAPTTAINPHRAVHGRPLRPAVLEAPGAAQASAGDAAKTVHATGIDEDTPEEDILSYFSSFGAIDRYRLCRNRSGGFRYGFFEYTNILGAQEVLKLDGTVCFGCVLHVTKSTTAIDVSKGGRMLSGREQEKYLHLAWEAEKAERIAADKAAGAEAGEGGAASPETVSPTAVSCRLVPTPTPGKGHLTSTPNAAGALMREVSKGREDGSPHPEEDQMGVRERTVHISGVESATSDVDLLTKLYSFGCIRQYRLCGDPRKPVRFGFFEYSTAAGAEGCLSLSGKDVFGKKLRVVMSDSAINGGRMITAVEQEHLARAAAAAQQHNAARMLQLARHVSVSSEPPSPDAMTPETQTPAPSTPAASALDSLSPASSSPSHILHAHHAQQHVAAQAPLAPTRRVAAGIVGEMAMDAALALAAQPKQRAAPARSPPLGAGRAPEGVVRSPECGGPSDPPQLLGGEEEL